MARFGGSRLSVRFFSAVLVTLISMVRSSRSSPCCTFSSSSTAACRTKSLPNIRLRKRRAGYLDPAGRGDFVGPREHRDLTHLHEIHADRVVDVRFGAAVFRQVIEIVLRLHFDRLVDVTSISSSSAGNSCSSSP